MLVCVRVQYLLHDFKVHNIALQLRMLLRNLHLAECRFPVQWLGRQADDKYRTQYLKDWNRR